MTQKERLIELINNYHYSGKPSEYLADYLLDNGVIVPPCKVGDKVFRIAPYYGRIAEEIVNGIVYESNEFEFWFETNERGKNSFDGASLGELYFLTREEAEQALKEREKN